MDRCDRGGDRVTSEDTGDTGVLTDPRHIEIPHLTTFIGLASVGVVSILAGLGIDYIKHADHPDLAAHEGVFTLSNPGHAFLAIGIVGVMIGIMGAAASLWTARKPVLQDDAVQGGGRSRHAVISGVVVIAVALVGGVTLTTFDGDSMDVASHASVHAPNDERPPTQHPAAEDPGQDMDDPEMDMDKPGSEDHAMSMNESPTRRDTSGLSEGERHELKQLLADTIAATTKYQDVATATADGYAVDSKAAQQFSTDLSLLPVGRTVHMPNRSNRFDGRTLDPTHPETLVYVMGSTGTLQLVGVVYRTEQGGIPDGPLPPSWWHTHAMCRDASGRSAGESRHGQCPEGSALPEQHVDMTHVWFTNEIETAYARIAPRKALGGSVASPDEQEARRWRLRIDSHVTSNRFATKSP